jgi:hypothetical protein
MLYNIGIVLNPWLFDSETNDEINKNILFFSHGRKREFDALKNHKPWRGRGR